MRRRADHSHSAEVAAAQVCSSGIFDTADGEFVPNKRAREKLLARRGEV
jgi:hypothetical protein